MLLPAGAAGRSWPGFCSEAQLPQCVRSSPGGPEDQPSPPAWSMPSPSAGTRVVNAGLG